MEIFRHINEYENYQISNYGRVRNCKTGKFLKLSTKGDKYHRVSLCGKKHRVHRLVANAFIPNPHNFQHVHHRGDLLNNCVSNLSWGNNGTLALKRDKHSLKKTGSNAYTAHFVFRKKQYILGEFKNRSSAKAAVISLKGLLSTMCF